MPDDPSTTSRGGDFISLEQGYEVRNWTRCFGCTESELRDAVRAVGHSADAVRRYLRQSRG